MDTQPDRTEPRALDALWIAIGAAGAACGVTFLFLGMRAVMNVGGFCASGGPYVIATPCPKGVALLMIGGVWGGLIFAGIWAWRAMKAGVHSLVLLLWPALFLSLGWNFLYYGLKSPGDGGLSGGWLICAVLFLVMGVVPLLPAVASAVHWVRSGTGHPDHDWRSRFGIGSIPAVMASMPSVMDSISSALAKAGTTHPDLATELERLEALRRSGALSEEEYQRAKTTVIGQGAGA
jgi:hypothetical protein